MQGLPWHAGAERTLVQRLQLQRLPHALLVTGAAGLGKRQLAMRWSQALLCKQRIGVTPCLDCAACHLFHAGSHPDFRIIERDEKTAVIPVDAIRGLIGWLTLHSHYAGLRVALLANADAMNQAAANSLLKTLEEPADGVVLLLTASHPERLPSTVLSRCQRIELAVPPIAEGRRWLAGQVPEDQVEALLAMAHGAPLQALALGNANLVARRRAYLDDLFGLAEGRVEPIDAAARHGKTPVALLVEWLLGCVADLARLQADPTAPCRDAPDASRWMVPLARKVRSRGVLRLVDTAYAGTRILQRGAPNPVLLLEGLLIQWWRLCYGARCECGQSP